MARYAGMPTQESTTGPAARIGRVSDLAARLASWLIVAMVVLGAWNAVARYSGRWLGLDLGSNAYLELQWYLFGAAFLLAGADTLRRDRHVRVDVLYARLGAVWRRRIDVAGTLLLLVPFCVFAIVASWPGVRNSWAVLEGSPDPGGLPRYPLRTLVPVAFSLVLLQGLALLTRARRR